MQGTVKFFDAEKDFGYITGRDGIDYMFTSQYVLPNSGGIRSGFEVDFTAENISGKHAARSVSSGMPLDTTTPHLNFTGPKGSWFDQWAFAPLYDFESDSRQYDGILPKLSQIALKEDWSFPDGNPYGVLESYFKYTFVRLHSEGKISTQAEPVSKWAAFNTGLVDRTYAPIYALFRENSRPPRPWKFVAFCTPGIGQYGKKLTSVFLNLPERAEYFSDPKDVFLDARMDIDPQFDHIIEDGIGRGRFPRSFLTANSPQGFDWSGFDSLDPERRAEFYLQLARAIEMDDQCYRAIKARISDAVRLARQRVSWNYKTAIPQYYPRHNQMSLLLPLSLTSDTSVDVALVVQRQPSGRYYGSTVLPLSWAYKNARLVCRPDSDWLTTEVSEDPHEDQEA